MNKVDKAPQLGKKNKLLQLFLKAAAITMVVCLTIVGIGVGAYYGFIYQGRPKNLTKDSNLESRDAEAEKQKEAVSSINQTIAVFGVDKDEIRTDVILVANFNSQTNKAKILSIPRDTKVEWTDAQRDKLRQLKGSMIYTTKINEMTAYGGIENIREFTVNEMENMLGVKIDNYAIINIEAFRKIVDTIGGVEVNVPQAMRYRDRSQGLNINLQPGLQMLDGDKAEQLVRFRHYPNGDVDRIGVQQIFMKAFAEKVMSPQMITKIPQFIPIIFDCLKSDISLTQIGTYYPFLKSFNTSNLTFKTLPGEGRYENGISYFFPDETAKSEIIQEMFFDKQPASSEPALGTDTEAQPKEPVIDKAVTIEVLNATGVKGVAGRTKDTLEKEGYTVARIDNYDATNLASTTIYAKQAEKAEQFKSYFKNASIEEKTELKYDVQIVIGNDYAAVAPER